MGRDDLFKKRKAQSLDSKKRRIASRLQNEWVLIVCEGEKTEPNYFNGLIIEYKLSTADVLITTPKGSAPMSLVNYAISKYKQACKQKSWFDRVYCVFDKDNHANYQEAIDKIKDQTPKQTFYAITSVPCFEYWLLLHFCNKAKPYESNCGRTAGEQVLKDLKTCFPLYEKNSKNIFKLLFPHLDDAIKNAKRINLESEKIGSDNPSTKVVELVEYLIGLKK